jgi:hypothetical protein
MGMNKRHIYKDSILKMINDSKVVYPKSDILIMDTWSSNFFDNYTFDNYNETRKQLIKETIFSSNLDDILKHPNFSKLKNLSNIYENLILEDSWVDILLTFDIIGNKCLSSDDGKFNFIELKKIALAKIEQYLNGY